MRVRLFLLFFVLFFRLGGAQAQQPVVLTDQLQEHIFSFGQIEQYEDPGGKLSFEQISTPAWSAKFSASKKSTPQTLHLQSAYWFRIRIDQKEVTKNPYLLEFFDQTIDDIEVWAPKNGGGYTHIQLGDKHDFASRSIRHKNFEVRLDNTQAGVHTWYFRVRSAQIADVIVVLRSVDYFIGYALNEYFYFGIFYGMIVVFSFYNLIMFIAIRQKQYLYYVLYNLSVGLYEMSTDGIAYHYLWPSWPEWNQIAYAFALYAVGVFALLFTRQLLYVKAKAPLLNKLILVIIGLRTAFLLYAYFFDRALLNYKFIEAIPLATAFFTGVYIYRRGYQPARFFVLGYSFLFLGFLLKFLIMLGFSSLNFGVVSYYSLSFCFVLEMIFLSLAIGDKVRLLKKKKDKTQQKMFRQMTINARLKDTLNTELEKKVEERTREVYHKSLIIEKKNEELERANLLLQQQAEEISRMNVLLEQDNFELQHSVEKVTRDRVMSADVDFEEFSRIYPDKDSCYDFLARLKWQHGYACKKCGNDHYYPGHISLSRRCSKCGYEESVTSYTIFHNTRIPINKAFYMIYLVYSTKGKISSHKLSELLTIRQSTCWTFGTRIKKVMDERRRELKKAGRNDWSQLVLE
ncbi:7TM diverse intracellular signaling domain-containing protein [Pedobacter sp. SYP-B3415]|uniref:7TM diverse intracellular signaling domain-containing protein n=1 Tax=Pedobacter sp. SYP-B3415 TaxID=2496641 RepID=UPI00101D232E|nr:7TM diverse intracellular signaling domain-containing protein [Pedobacter sp. SYP-B3415]